VPEITELLAKCLAQLLFPGPAHLGCGEVVSPGDPVVGARFGYLSSQGLIENINEAFSFYLCVSLSRFKSVG
jgi:hypothetical protein